MGEPQPVHQIDASIYVLELKWTVDNGAVANVTLELKVTETESVGEELA
jgi:hypothetical protein